MLDEDPEPPVHPPEGALALADRLADVLDPRRRDRAPIVGLQGGQGSGKSTVAAALTDVLARRGIRFATLSLDDAYLGHAARRELADRVHPLLATRGPPGTHDITLLIDLLDRLSTSTGDVAVPRFDKGLDDRAAPAVVRGPFDLVLLEGWCVGLPPVPEATLVTPINALERDDDPGGRWRRYVAAALAGPYAGLWARLDSLIVVQAPSWSTIVRWRQQAEATLRATGAVRAMSVAEVERFMQHYERWARFGLDVLPDRADVLVRLDEDRAVTDVVCRARSPG